MSDQKFRGL
jgi:hypothetical protein